MRSDVKHAGTVAAKHSVARGFGAQEWADAETRGDLLRLGLGTVEVTGRISEDDGALAAVGALERVHEGHEARRGLDDKPGPLR